MRCALTADFLNPNGRLVYRDIGLSVLDEAGISHAFFSEHTPEVSPQQLREFDAVISLAPKYTIASLREAADRLLTIVRFGVGFDMVDVQACTEAGVALCVTRGAVNHSVAEAILTWMLALSHRLADKNRLVRQGRWAERANYMGSELRGRTVGLVGAGGIGRRLAEILRGLGMNQPLVFDPYLSETAAAEIGVYRVSLQELMSSSDFVSINCPLTEETRGLIGAAEIAMMRPDAFLINMARGGIVSEDALFTALKERRIAGAATDVFETEPANSNHPFCGLDNILLAPHCFAWTDELFSEIGHMAARAVVQFARGQVPESLLVNPEVLQHSSFQRKLRNLSG